MEDYRDRLKQLLEDVEDLTSDLDADEEVDFAVAQRIVTILDEVRMDVEDAKKLSSEL